MRKLLLNRRVVIAILVVGGLLAMAFWPSAVPVDVATVRRGPLVAIGMSCQRRSPGACCASTSSRAIESNAAR